MVGPESSLPSHYALRLTPYAKVLLISLVAGLSAWPISLFAAPTAGEPSPADFLYRIAEDHRRAGQIDEAIHELKKALMINPGYEKAMRELAVLESLKQSEQERLMEKNLEQIQKRLEEATRTLGARDRAMLEALEKVRMPAPGGAAQPPYPTGLPQAAAPSAPSGAVP